MLFVILTQDHFKPNRSGVKVSADPDEYDFEDEEYLTEDVADFEAEVK